jgi:competence protein ComEA
MQLSRRQILAYAAVAAVVLALGVRYVVAPKSAGAPAGDQLVLTPDSPAASTSPQASAAADVMVYVCGAVRSPGVVRLPAGARVADALEMAGGATGKAELSAVNLAAKVADGQQIVVPDRAQAAAGAAVASSTGAGGVGAAAGGTGAAVPGALVNINTASLEELDALQGVGPSTAQKIIDYRTANGGFKSIDEIKDVPGIGDAKFAAMKDSITI